MPSLYHLYTKSMETPLHLRYTNAGALHIGRCVARRGRQPLNFFPGKKRGTLWQ
jgi:hypothetical protein